MSGPWEDDEVLKRLRAHLRALAAERAIEEARLIEEAKR